MDMKLTKQDSLKEVDKEELWYADALLHYCYHKVKMQGQSMEGWSPDEMLKYHLDVLRELQSRELKHFVRDDELDKDSMCFLKDCASIYLSDEAATKDGA